MYTQRNVVQVGVTPSKTNYNSGSGAVTFRELAIATHRDQLMSAFEGPSNE